MLPVTFAEFHTATIKVLRKPLNTGRRSDTQG